MGLTHQSTGLELMKEILLDQIKSPGNFVIALAGNPNTGKSTVFNSLTGLNQHTGNWPGKTVTNARGRFTHNNCNFTLVDLPGTYSLCANSSEEEVARDFICFGMPDAVVAVVDATCLERNLNLVLQILEITGDVIVCVNLLDEAERKKIHIDLNKLSELLGVPVVGTNARDGRGMEQLKDAMYKMAAGIIKVNPVKVVYDDVVEGAVRLIQPYIEKNIMPEINSRWLALRLIEKDKTVLDSFKKYIGQILEENDDICCAMEKTEQYLKQNGIEEEVLDRIVASIVKKAEEICRASVVFEDVQYNHFDRKIDNILTSSTFGIPVMILLLGCIFWITLQGANYPSEVLSSWLFWIESRLTEFFAWTALPEWLHGALILGMYRTTAWVVSVMLPPMAIFFPLFTILEDLGYLPRVAFNLDKFFKKACAHGKQALTMCMGFGCNAAGVIACRIIDSPRERLIAILTNNYVPCNGRFPTLIAMAMIFIAGGEGKYRAVVAAISIIGVIILGIIITLFVSKILSATMLKGLPSTFALELPPYRKPQIGRIIVRSIYDRTIFVLGRAVMVAAPAGLITWILANTYAGDASLLHHCATFLDPFARMLGLDGFILTAFILGFPANEIVIPILIMSYMSYGHMVELDSLNSMRQLFLANGWTWITAVCTMLFCLNHFPCGTTLLTIYKETQSIKWPLIAFLINTATGIALCFSLNLIFRFPVVATAQYTYLRWLTCRQ
ncbi:MAG: ferrous iron transport protein B [Tepidanaerobacteraceae bacterium]|nr:ferrous iron transport protein B [Tepidanaerobacteraceae bacterium]